MKAALMIIGLLVSASFACVSADAKHLTVVYTANTSGKLTACGCPHDPYGGLAERATLIEELRAKEGPLLLLDAGNMVSLFGDFDLRAKYVMRLMNLIGYDAAGVGRLEMFKNTAKALAIDDIAKFPLISATIARNTGHTPLFQRFLLKKTGAVTVGITSVTDTTCYIPDINRTYDFSILPWEHELRDVLAEMEGKADFIVVLSQMSRQDNAKLLESFPSVDLVIQGLGNAHFEQPIPVSGGYLVAPGDRGQFVGIVRFEKTGGGPLILRKSELSPVLDIAQDHDAMKIVREYYRKRK